MSFPGEGEAGKKRKKRTLSCVQNILPKQRLEFWSSEPVGRSE